MKDKKIIKNILIGLVVAIVLLGVYSMLAAKKPQQDSGGLTSRLGSSSVGQIRETDTVIVNAEILKILGSIESIELEDGIFINPIFRKLKDKSFHVDRPTRIGRKNPFLPIGYDALVAQKETEINNSVENTIISNFIEGQGDAGKENFFDETNI